MGNTAGYLRLFFIQMVMLWSLTPLSAAASARMPGASEPIWLLHKTRLHNFQSTPDLPQQIDVLIIGAGLTGASAAYHLANRGLSIAMVDSRGVGEGASGHNGGNFELMPESFFGNYQGLVHERQKFLSDAFPLLSATEVSRRAGLQAKILIRFGLENARIFKDILQRESISADVSDAGWLRIANTKEDELALYGDFELVRSMGIDIQMWSPAQILQRVGIRSEFAGRMAPGFGNYHPYKFVTGVVENVLNKGVQLYTQTRVEKIDWRSAADMPIRVETSRGVIYAKHVVLATDAYTSNLVPELSAVYPYQSQVVSFDDVPNRLQGMTVTEEYGDLYYNGPLATHYRDANGVERMVLVIGGGPDRPVADADKPRLSRAAFNIVLEQARIRFPELANQMVARTWTGVFGFTDDRFPILDFIHPQNPSDMRVVAFVGSQGYGGSMSMFGGKLLAEMVIGSPKASAQLLARFAPRQDFALERFVKPLVLSSPPLQCAQALQSQSHLVMLNAPKLFH